jgi:hypothetical protein
MAYNFQTGKCKIKLSMEYENVTQKVSLYVIFLILHSGGWNQGPLVTAAT